MYIEFTCKGIVFQADVEITEDVPAQLFGHPDSRMPAEGGEFEFLSLSTCVGYDCSDLLDKDAWKDALNEAAYKAAIDLLEEEKWENAIAAYEYRMSDEATYLKNFTY